MKSCDLVEQPPVLNDIMQARKPPRASLGVGSRRPSRVVLVKGHSGGHSRCSLRAVWATVARGRSHIAGRAAPQGPRETRVRRSLRRRVPTKRPPPWGPAGSRGDGGGDLRPGASRAPPPSQAPLSCWPRTSRTLCYRASPC